MVDNDAGVNGMIDDGAARGGRDADVVVLVDGDNAANILKHIDEFVRKLRPRRCAAHAFVSRSLPTSFHTRAYARTRHT